MNLLLVISAILMQVPINLEKDTSRRLARMSQYSPENTYLYNFTNKYTTDLYILFLVFGYVLSFIPLVNGIEVHWFICLVIHLILAFLITPFIVFFLYPKMRIFTKRLINTIGITNLILAIIFFIIGITI